MSKIYRAQWRKPYRAMKLSRRIKTSTGMIAKAAKLYKRGVKNNDRETLLAAESALDEYDRLLELQEHQREQRTAKRAIKLMNRALSGDINALVTILKATGDLPKDYQIRD